MARQNQKWSMEGVLLPGKIRKRGCSSSASSSSSVIQNYRFKRAILVGKRGGSGTPVPTWKLMGTRSPMRRHMDSPRYATGGKQQPQQQRVSARKLAATLWEMNEMPSPPVKEGFKKEMRMRAKERDRHSASLPPHLSDPSHTPVSERTDQSGTVSRQRRASSISQRLMLAERNVAPLDSLSNASLMEIETRSRAQTPTGSVYGVKSCLKDVSNALITSKELLKIINRMWGQEERPSSSMSLISALHAELERARLLVNQLVQDQCLDMNEIKYLMKCFAEEKAAWENKERELVEAAIESIVGELDVERKLRKRFEGLNKKLGKELAETKTCLLKLVKELESEKRARGVIEQVCDELVRGVGKEKAEVEEHKRESVKVHEEIEKERELMQLADVLYEERVQMKLSEAKYQLEEKNAAVDNMRSQLEAFFGPKRAVDTGRGSLNHLDNEEVAAYLDRTRINSQQNEEHEEDGEVEDGEKCEEDSAESDLHSIELNMDNKNQSYKWTYPSGIPRDLRKVFKEEKIKGRKSTSGKKEPRRTTSLQRSISDGVEWITHKARLQDLGDGLDWKRFSELEKQAQGKVSANEMLGCKLAKGVKDDFLFGCRIDSPRVHASPTRQGRQTWPSRDPGNIPQDRPSMVPGSFLKSRLAGVTDEDLNARKSKRKTKVKSKLYYKG
ncbi:hypothetical protein CFOL_v3_01167, partial [Cephalotus follicularis]